MVNGEILEATCGDRRTGGVNVDAGVNEGGDGRDGGDGDSELLAGAENFVGGAEDVITGAAEVGDVGGLLEEVLGDGDEQALAEDGEEEVAVEMLDDEMEHEGGADGATGAAVLVVNERVSGHVAGPDESGDGITGDAEGVIDPHGAELVAGVFDVAVGDDEALHTLGLLPRALVAEVLESHEAAGDLAEGGDAVEDLVEFDFVEFLVVVEVAHLLLGLVDEGDGLDEKAGVIERLFASADVVVEVADLPAEFEPSFESALVMDTDTRGIFGGGLAGLLALLVSLPCVGRLALDKFNGEATASRGLDGTADNALIAGVLDVAGVLHVDRRKTEYESILVYQDGYGLLKGLPETEVDIALLHLDDDLCPERLQAGFLLTHDLWGPLRRMSA